MTIIVIPGESDFFGFRALADPARLTLQWHRRYLSVI